MNFYGSPLVARRLFQEPCLIIKAGDSIAGTVETNLILMLRNSHPFGGFWSAGVEVLFGAGWQGELRPVDRNLSTQVSFTGNYYSPLGSAEFQFNGTPFVLNPFPIWANRIYDQMSSIMSGVTDLGQNLISRSQVGWGGLSDWLQARNDILLRGVYYNTGVDPDANQMEIFGRKESSNDLVMGTPGPIGAGAAGEFRSADGTLDMSGVASNDPIWISNRGANSGPTIPNGRILAYLGHWVMLPASIPHWSLINIARGGTYIDNFLDVTRIPAESWGKLSGGHLNPQGQSTLCLFAFGTNEPNETTKTQYVAKTIALMARIRETWGQDTMFILIAPYQALGMLEAKRVMIGDAYRAVVDADVPGMSLMIDLGRKYPDNAAIAGYLDGQGVHPTGQGKGWYVEAWMDEARNAMASPIGVSGNVDNTTITVEEIEIG